MDGAGPLDGVRVLDFSLVMSGPHCTRMLVDLGADVVKVEPPDGDLTRFFRPRAGSIALYHAQQNCGKRNISADLRRPEAVELLLRLVQRVDVLVENFRPGVMDRLGLGYAAASARNPRLAYASISGFGQRGSSAGRRAYADIIHAEMGMTEMLERGDGHQDNPFNHADTYTGLECLAGVLAALQEWAAGLDGPEALERALEPSRLATGVVRSVEEAGAGTWARERGAVVEVDDRSGGRLRLPNSPWRFSDATTGVRGVPAYRGE